MCCVGNSARPRAHSFSAYIPTLPVASAGSLGRVARALGIDGTDYATSYTASSFVSYYAQRITSACVLNGARGVFKALGQAKAKFAKSMTAAAAAAHEGA